MFKHFTLILFCVFLFSFVSCNSQEKSKAQPQAENHLHGTINQRNDVPFDSVLVDSFFTAFPDLAVYKTDIVNVYSAHKFHHLWYDSKGLLEFGSSLYEKVKNIEEEGVLMKFPYQEKLDGVFVEEIENNLTETQTDLMLSCLFMFYSAKVYQGLDEKTTKSIEWLLPRKHMSYEGLLDSVMLNPAMLEQDEKLIFSQYYKLRSVLQKYRAIEKSGGWKPIMFDEKFKSISPGDTSAVLKQVRERLFVTGDLAVNNGSNLYDTTLVRAIKKYQLRNGKSPSAVLSKTLINEMNVPVSERIKTLMVNMERCRWISPDIASADELIVVNIPSYKLNMFRGGKSVFESPVVVGKMMTRTVIFSGKMSYIVFSPYWNIPQSIINKDVKPGMARNKNYLASHNMEWNNGQVRQKPGKNNSLGLVKFMFPNSNNIYLHDTPSKSLFEKDSRAFSHGCVRVGKPRDLAIKILENDPNWTPAKIDAAMNAGKENSYTLKKKIPVYIGYFTAWVNAEGEVNFYEDVYERDQRLFDLLAN